ncbi:hypothetical protein ACFE04_030253 [Oxalis oulophora]
MAASMEGVEVDGVDRISHLPHHILQHIQSFLPMKEAKRNIVLSKAWKQVMFAPTILDLDESFFPKHLWHKFEVDEDIEAIILRMFDHVDQILGPLGEHKFSKNRFKLDMHLIELDWSHLDKLYSLPHRILVQKSIVTLAIRGCKIQLLPTDFKTNLLCLKKLTLYKVHLNDETMHKVIVGCRLLEDLNIHKCEGFSRLHLPNCLDQESSSHYLSIRLCTTLGGIEIETPNLLGFEYYGDSVGFSWNGTKPSHCSIFLCLASYIDPRNEAGLPNWYLEWIEFLAKFNIEGCREMEISSFLDKTLIFPHNVRLAQPLPDIKKLTVKLFRRHGRICFSEEVKDSIHWLSPQSEKSFEFFSKYSKPFRN